MATKSGERPLWKTTVFQRLLNLPEPGYDAKAAKAAKQAAREGVAPGSFAPPVEPQRSAVNPWVAAATGAPTAPQAPEKARLVGAPITTASGVPWQIAEGSKSAKAWRRIGRVAATIVIALFAWVGFRSTFFPGEEAPPPELPASVTFDSQSASGVATRFAIAALTWNEDAPERQSQAVALDYADGPSNLGWNRKGRQDVAQAIAGGLVIADDGASAIATVLVQLVSYTREGSEGDWTWVATEWASVEVPVQLSDGRMVATGPPSLTGQPEPVAPELPATPKSDEALTTVTADTAEAFFVAYGAGDVAAVEAPGAAIDAPTDRWEFDSLATWQVFEGEGETRQALATVVWGVAGEPQTYTATYDVTLSTVSGGGADRWQVSAITAGSTPSLN